MTKVLEEKDSKINGKVVAVRSLGLGTYLQVTGLTQSGGVVVTVWKETLRKLKNKGFKPKTCLILGLGGGSVAQLIGKYWGEAKIIGVDLDPVMVEMGEKYLNFDKTRLKVVISDAFSFVAQSRQKFDLIIVDTYLGYDFPKKLEKTSFLKKISSLLKKGGLVIFNRTYFDKYRAQSVKFGKSLEKVFKKIETFYPEANLMFICGS